jgi:predicted Ser/Thr protein kinase
MADIFDLFNRASDSVRTEYLARRQVLSYAEYLSLFATQPQFHLRDAARYLLDAIDYFGSEKIEKPWGRVTRHKIFDQNFTDESFRLVGQEAAQAAVRSAIAAQVRDGRVNRLVVIHGPNGSAKTTLVNCLFRGLDHYSRLDEGELFRFRWVFPSRATSAGRIGFGGGPGGEALESFAHLEDDQIESVLECEVRDHPLLLLPKAERIELAEQALDRAGQGDFQIPEYFLHASLCHRCRQVADALMRRYQGDLRKVLAHVQVEPWAMSRRYRRGLIQVGPELSADASQRQVTADRSLSALPIELQNMTLFETFGPLVDGSGGIVEFDDMLKRPLDSYKYLLGTIETGEVMLGQSILKLNTVLMATTNDVMLEAFTEHHDYLSFRDRLTLVPVPYITRRSDERQIYELQLVPHVRCHVAPFAVDAVAHWAVLTRLHKPDPQRYQEPLKSIVTHLAAIQKGDLYEDGSVPEELSDEHAAELISGIKRLRTEDSASWQYEGRFGASPRLVRQVLLAASLSEDYDCLSPFAALDEIAELTGRTREHPFLQREGEQGGYHDFDGFVEQLEGRILEDIETQIRAASGLVEESRYDDLLAKYVNHVSQQVKGEKVLDETTGEYKDPDESLMKKVEESIKDAEDDTDEFRRGVISRIAAWAIEHPKQKLNLGAVLPGHLRRLKDAYFEEHRTRVAAAARYALEVVSDEADKLDRESREEGERLLERLLTEHGYCRSCARDGLARVLKKRFDDS